MSAQSTQRVLLLKVRQGQKHVENVWTWANLFGGRCFFSINWILLTFVGFFFDCQDMDSDTSYRRLLCETLRVTQV